MFLGRGKPKAGEFARTGVVTKLLGLALKNVQNTPRSARLDALPVSAKNALARKRFSGFLPVRCLAPDSFAGWGYGLTGRGWLAPGHSE